MGILGTNRMIWDNFWILFLLFSSASYFLFILCPWTGPKSRAHGPGGRGSGRLEKVGMGGAHPPHPFWLFFLDNFVWACS